MWERKKTVKYTNFQAHRFKLNWPCGFFANLYAYRKKSACTFCCCCCCPNPFIFRKQINFLRWYLSLFGIRVRAKITYYAAAAAAAAEYNIVELTAISWLTVSFISPLHFVYSCSLSHSLSRCLFVPKKNVFPASVRASLLRIWATKLNWTETNDDKHDLCTHSSIRLQMGLMTMGFRFIYRDEWKEQTTLIDRNTFSHTAGEKMPTNADIECVCVCVLHAHTNIPEMFCKSAPFLLHQSKCSEFAYIKSIVCLCNSETLATEFFLYT